MDSWLTELFKLQPIGLVMVSYLSHGLQNKLLDWQSGHGLNSILNILKCSAGTCSVN